MFTFRSIPSGKISLIFAELDRFDKPLAQCESLQEKWCYSLKHVGKLNELPDGLRVRTFERLKHVGKLNELPDGLRVRTFERLFEACEIARFSPEKKLQYESDMIMERDYYNILETAKEDGEAKGRESGLAEGRLEKAKEIARAMRAAGMDITQISSLTGLSEDEVVRLK